LERDGYAGKDFKPVFLSWVNDPDCVQSQFEAESLTESEYLNNLEATLGFKLRQEQRNFWVAQYGELGDAIYQEYPATPEEAFTKVNDGSYYGAKYNRYVVKLGRICHDLYDNNLPVHVAMDLGMNDTFSLTYFQRWGEEWRIIDEYFNSGEGLEHYVTKIEDTGYEIGSVICPHDINVRELGMGTSRLLRLNELGVRNIIVLPRAPINDGIESVRKLIPNLWIDYRCTQHLGMFVSYSKEWDEANEVWKNKPVHNKWSHVADSTRYMASSNVSTRAMITKRAVASSDVIDGTAF
jgi:hypothetical protein